MPYRFHTLCRRPRSWPQVTMLLPVEAMRKHYQDQISGGRKNKHINKTRKRDSKRLHGGGGGVERKITSSSRPLENQSYLCAVKVNHQRLDRLCNLGSDEMFVGHHTQIDLCWIIFVINGPGIKPHGIIGSRFHEKIFCSKDIWTKWHHVTMESAKPDRYTAVEFTSKVIRLRGYCGFFFR